MSEAEQERIANEVFQKVQKQSDNIKEKIRIAENMISLVPYYWDPMEYLCIVKQVDGFQKGAVTISESELVATQLNNFPRKPLSAISEGINLSTDTTKQGRAINLLQTNLKLYSHGQGWLRLAHLYLTRHSHLAIDCVKRGMMYAKKLTEDHPEYTVNWYVELWNAQEKKINFGSPVCAQICCSAWVLPMRIRRNTKRHCRYYIEHKRSTQRKKQAQKLN